MAVVDYIPTFEYAKELRAFGYTGSNKLDAVLRWFRDEQNIHINPVYGPGNYPYTVRVWIEPNGQERELTMPNINYGDYYRAAWAGIYRARHYIKTNKPVVPLKAKITFRQLT